LSSRAQALQRWRRISSAHTCCHLKNFLCPVTFWLQ